MKILRLYKTAKSIKDIIAQYKLDDPFLLFFFTKYEKIMEWKNIKTVDDINAFINNTLLPQLKTRINPEAENNLYMKDIDLEKEFEHAIGDPNVQEVKRIFNTQGPGSKRT